MKQFIKLVLEYCDLEPQLSEDGTSHESIKDDNIISLIASKLTRSDIIELDRDLIENLMERNLSDNFRKFLEEILKISSEKSQISKNKKDLEILLESADDLTQSILINGIQNYIK